MLFAYAFLRERATRREYLALGGIAVGAFLVTTQLRFGDVRFLEFLVGNIMLVAAAACWGSSNTMSTVLLRRIPIVSLLEIQLVIGAAVFGGIVAVTATPLAVPLSILPVLILLSLSAVGVFSILFFYAFRTIGAMRTGAVLPSSALWGILLALYVFPPERRSRARGAPGHRPDLRRIGCTRAERRVGDAQESARRDEASHVGPAIAHDPRRLEGLRADRRSPRRGFDEGPTAAARIAPGPRLARGTGRPPEERLRRDADRCERGRDARRDRRRRGCRPGCRPDGPYVPRGPRVGRGDCLVRGRGRASVPGPASSRSDEADARGNGRRPRRGPGGTRWRDRDRIQARRRTNSGPPEGRGGPRLQSAAQRRHLEPSGDRRGRPVAPRLGVPRGGGSRRDGPRGDTAPVPRPHAPIPPRARHRGRPRGDPAELGP